MVAHPGPMTGHHRGQKDHQECVIFDGGAQAQPCYVLKYKVWHGTTSCGTFIPCVFYDQIVILLVGVEGAAQGPAGGAKAELSFALEEEAARGPESGMR